MKITTKVLCISMLFSAAAPSMFFSSEKEKNNGENLLEIGSNFAITKTSGGKEHFCIASGPQEKIPEVAWLKVTTNSGKDKFISFSQLWLNNFKAMQLAHYVRQNDKINCIKALEENADPKHKLETSDPYWKGLDGMTPLEIAYDEYEQSQNPKTLELCKLLQKAKVIPKQNYFIRLMPLPLEFGFTQQ